MRRALPLLIPVLLAVGTGLPAVSGGLIRDDTLYVVLNPHVTEPTPPSLMFSSPFQPEHELGLFRPVTTQSLRFDFIISRVFNLPVNQDSAPVWHVTNLLLAAGAAALVYSLGRGIGFGPTAAGMAAALFAAHPARTEAVLWISGRAECLMTLFSLATLTIAARGGRGWRGPAAAALAVLAFWSKEQAIVLLLLVPMLPRLPRAERTRIALWVGGALAVAFAWRTVVVGLGPEGGQQVLHGWGFADRAILGTSFLGDYVSLTLLPHPLLNEYDEPATMTAWVALGVGIAFVGLFVWRCFRDTRDAFLLGLFAGPLAIVANVLYVTGETFGERFLALPIAGATLFIVRVISRWPRMGGSILFTATAVCAAMTLNRSFDYASDESLMRALVEDAPGQSSSWRLLATITKRDLDEQTGLASQSQQDQTSQAGLRSLQASGSEEARLLKELLREDHGAAQQRHLARTFELRTKLEAELRRALSLDESDHKTRLDLVRFLQNKGMPKARGGSINLLALREAEAHARWVVQHLPSIYEAHNVLAQILLARASKLSGEPRTRLLLEAERELRETLRLEPRSSSAGQDLSRILIFGRRKAEARVFLEEQRAVFAKLSEDRWWDVRGPQLEAAVIRSIAQLDGQPNQGLTDGLPHLEEALRRARSAPLRTELITGHIAETLRKLGRHGAAIRAVGSEIENLSSRIGTARNQSDLMTALSMLEMQRQDISAAAKWYERASRESQRASVARNMLRAAARLHERHAASLPASPDRISGLREAARLRRLASMLPD